MPDREAQTDEHRTEQLGHKSEEDRETLRGERTPAGDPHDDTDPQSG